MSEDKFELDQETKDKIDRFNEAIATIENEFMHWVVVFKDIGYGRMIQMIKQQWCKDLLASGLDEKATRAATIDCLR